MLIWKSSNFVGWGTLCILATLGPVMSKVKCKLSDYALLWVYVMSRGLSPAYISIITCQLPIVKKIEDKLWI